MNNFFIFSILLLHIFISEVNIEGKYQVCSMACETVQIFPDSTFDYRFDGDLYHGEGCFGKITKIGENLFLANSSVQPIPIIEDYDSTKSDIYITVKDESNDLLDGANVYIETEKDTLHFVSDHNGLVTFRNTIIKNIWVNFIGVPHSVYSPKENKSNVFEIINIIDPNYVYVTNEIWYIDKDSLFFKNRDQKFSLKKVL